MIKPKLKANMSLSGIRDFESFSYTNMMKNTFQNIKSKKSFQDITN